MQILGVDQTLNIIALALLKLACLKTTRLEPWLVQYAVQLYDIGKEVKTSHLNLIHVAAGYGGVGGSVVMFTCRTAQIEEVPYHSLIEEWVDEIKTISEFAKRLDFYLLHSHVVSETMLYT